MTSKRPFAVTSRSVTISAEQKRVKLSTHNDELLNAFDEVNATTNEIQAIDRIQYVINNHANNPLLDAKILERVKDAFNTDTTPRLECKLWLLVKRCLSGYVYSDTAYFVQLAKKSLNSVSPLVRRNGVQFLGIYINDDDDLLHLIINAMNDSDARIRFEAVQSLIRIFNRGRKLPETVYKLTLNLTEDTSEKVRKLNLRLISIIAQNDPERKVHARGMETHELIRLIDDAFAWICHAINDPFYQVRQTAAMLLGTFSDVSIAFLMQTLEKNLMSNLNKVKSFNERAKGENHEFSSGRKFEQDKAVRGEVEDDNNVISRGACGAFIHGLEDEFRHVRVASIYALCELASKESTGNFAKTTMDYLVDMLNDEIEEVRLQAVNACCKLAGKVPVLLEDQLENVLTSCLPDARQDIRLSTHRLLASCHLLSRNCLYITIEELLKSLEKYSADQYSIYKAFRDLGKNHPNFVAALTPKLLDIHPFYDTREIDISDPSYAAKMIMILNASKECASLSQFFPPFIGRHYSYLRDVFPKLVPQLVFFESSSSEAFKQSDNERLIIEYLLSRVKDIKSSIHGPDSVLTSLQRVQAMELTHDERQCVEVHYHFLQLQALLLTDNKCFTTSQYRLKKCLNLADKLLNLYLGLSCEEILKIEQLKLRALSSLLSAQSKKLPLNENERVRSSNIQDSIQRIERLLKSNDLTTDKFTTTIIRECKNITRESLLLAFIEKLVKEEIELSVITSRSTRGISGSLSFPAKGASFKWVATIGHTVTIRGSIITCRSPYERLCIRVRYDVDLSALFFPKLSDITQIDDQRYEFQVPIRLNSDKVWNDSVRVDVEFCWIFQQSCFLGETDINPADGLILLDRRSYDCTSRVPNGVVNLC